MEITVGKKYKNKKTDTIYTLGDISNGNIYLYSGGVCVGICPVEKASEYYELVDAKENKVDHPSHYSWLKEKCGVEVIDIVRCLDFDLGNALKYILRAGHKKEEGYTNKEKTIEDLEKAIWYINDKITTLREQ